jgi:hypothetical protein
MFNESKFLELEFSARYGRWKGQCKFASVIKKCQDIKVILELFNDAI